MKVYVDQDEVWPDYSEARPANPDGTYAEWQEQYAVEMPELLWKEYLYARKEYFELSDKVDKFMEKIKR